jgi:hypothetical protein
MRLIWGIALSIFILLYSQNTYPQSTGNERDQAILAMLQRINSNFDPYARARLAHSNSNKSFNACIEMVKRKLKTNCKSEYDDSTNKYNLLKAASAKWDQYVESLRAQFQAEWHYLAKDMVNTGCVSGMDGMPQNPTCDVIKKRVEELTNRYDTYFRFIERLLTQLYQTQ